MKGIAFHPAMVQAILSGHKTETRRLVGPPKVSGRPVKAPCKAGDHLYVREHFRLIKTLDGLAPREVAPASRSWWIRYEADQAERGGLVGSPSVAPGRFRHGRFMPSWASRLALEVLAVRREPVQQIDEAGALAEGVSSPSALALLDEHRDDPPRRRFAWLWTVMHPGSWREDPEVWVITFKAQRIEP